MEKVVQFQYNKENAMVMESICGRMFEFHGNKPTLVPRTLLRKEEIKRLEQKGILRVRSKSEHDINEKKEHKKKTEKE